MHTARLRLVAVYHHISDAKPLVMSISNSFIHEPLVGQQPCSPQVLLEAIVCTTVHVWTAKSALPLQLKPLRQARQACHGLPSLATL